MLGIEFTAWPEMLAWPYLMIQGWLPYRDIAIAHTPLVIVALSLFYKLFGVGIVQLKIFTWGMILLNTYLTFWVANKIYSKKTAIWSVIFYIPLVFFYQGNGIWFDMALVPWALCLYYCISQKHYFKSGIAFGLGILSKQTFAYFLLPIAASLINKKNIDSDEVTTKTLDNIKQFIFGGSIILLLFCFMMLVLGILDDFYFWAIKFGTFYLPKADGQILFPSPRQLLISIFPFTIFVFNPSLVLWALSGSLGSYPRWELFHFQPALPFLAYTIANVFLSKKFKYLVYLYLVVLTIILSRGIYRELNKQTRFYEPGVQKIVSELSGHDVKKLYVLNYWDNLYSLTGTLPVTKPLIPYIPWYLDLPGAKESITGDVKSNLPDAIVVGDMTKLNIDQLIKLLEKYYQCKKVEQVDICFKNR